MMELFLVSGMISPLEIAISIFCGLAFLIGFGISSAKGGYRDFVRTTLENDQAIREKRSLLKKTPLALKK